MCLPMAFSRVVLEVMVYIFEMHLSRPTNIKAWADLVKNEKNLEDESNESKLSRYLKFIQSISSWLRFRIRTRITHFRAMLNCTSEAQPRSENSSLLKVEQLFQIKIVHDTFHWKTLWSKTTFEKCVFQWYTLVETHSWKLFLKNIS